MHELFSPTIQIRSSSFSSYAGTSKMLLYGHDIIHYSSRFSLARIFPLVVGVWFFLNSVYSLHSTPVKSYVKSKNNRRIIDNFQILLFKLDVLHVETWLATTDPTHRRRFKPNLWSVYVFSPFLFLNVLILHIILFNRCQKWIQQASKPDYRYSQFETSNLFDPKVLY